MFRTQSRANLSRGMFWTSWLNIYPTFPIYLFSALDLGPSRIWQLLLKCGDTVVDRIGEVHESLYWPGIWV